MSSAPSLPLRRLDTATDIPTRNGHLGEAEELTMRADDFFTEDSEEEALVAFSTAHVQIQPRDNLRASAQPEYDDLEIVLGPAELAGIPSRCSV